VASGDVHAKTVEEAAASDPIPFPDLDEGRREPLKDVTVRPSQGRGRGIFADRDFAEGDLIERCPVLVCSEKSRVPFARTRLNDYHFNWLPKNDTVVIALGYGSLYNHSQTPNADWVNHIDHNLMDFVALKPIAAGDEIFVNYRYAGGRLPEWYDEGKTPAEGAADKLTQSPDEPADK
jgi:hypothetical protein